MVLSGATSADRHVVPWATVDPGRIFVAASTRALTRMPLPLHRQLSVLPPAVVVNG